MMRQAFRCNRALGKHELAHAGGTLTVHQWRFDWGQAWTAHDSTAQRVNEMQHCEKCNKNYTAKNSACSFVDSPSTLMCFCLCYDGPTTTPPPPFCWGRRNDTRRLKCATDWKFNYVFRLDEQKVQVFHFMYWNMGLSLLLTYQNGSQVLQVCKFRKQKILFLCFSRYSTQAAHFALNIVAVAIRVEEETYTHCTEGALCKRASRGFRCMRWAFLAH